MSTITPHIDLQHFTKSQLIFDDKETKDILIFFFPYDRQLISNAVITQPLRELAQRLLVAAVDASYKIGWVETLWKATAFPGTGVRKSLKKLAKKAAMHWLKNIIHRSDLEHAKIYDSVRSALSMRFRFVLRDKLLAENTTTTTSLIATTIHISQTSSQKAWC